MPNAMTGARRRSATGKKIATSKSSPSGNPPLLTCAAPRTPMNVSHTATKAPTAQSMAIQWPRRIRLVSGGRGASAVDPG